MKKNIGITMRVVKTAEYPEERDALSRDLINYVSRVLPEYNIVPMINLPRGVERRISDLKISGVILSGGNDLGESRLRDETEAGIAKYCMRHNLPLLGICRGMQALNIVTGGKLRKDILHATGEDHVVPSHPIDILPPSPVEYKGRERSIRVNSFHRQGVTSDGISKEFKIFAVTRSGVVEGIYHRKKPVIGIQWHPERKNSCRSFDDKILRFLFK